MSFLSAAQPFHQFRHTPPTPLLPLAALQPPTTDMLSFIVPDALSGALASFTGRQREIRGIPPSAWPPPDDACWELLGTPRDELAALYQAFDGQLLFPGLRGYEKARSAVEDTFPKPRVIAICHSDDDVRHCFQWARARGWLISVRSGGHNGAGFHLCNGMTLDLQNLSAIEENREKGEVVVGAGTLWREIGAHLDGSRFFLPGGTCGHVAAAGFTLGGGYSLVSRTFGLTCDLLQEVRLLLPDGKTVVRASETSHPDLFWALRGGGGGQFGVALDLTYRLLEEPFFFGFVLNWRLKDAPDVLAHLEQRHMSSERHPVPFGYLVALTTLSREDDPEAVEGEPSLSILGIFRGSEADASDYLKDLLAIGDSSWRWRSEDRFHHLNQKIFGVLPYRALGLQQANKLEVTGYVDEPGQVDWKSLCAKLARAPNPGTLIAAEPYGGAIAQVAPDGTAFPHRQALLNLKLNSYWKKDWAYNKDRPSAQQWLDGAAAIAGPALNGHVYVNYMRENVVDYRNAYWGKNFHRLLGIKQQYDPDPVFRFPQAIAPR